jgi:integrase
MSGAAHPGGGAIHLHRFFCPPIAPSSLNNLVYRVWRPLQRSLGLVDDIGEPLFDFHALRDFAARLWIELRFSPERLQALLGHSSITLTFDRYGHLFPSTEDDHERFCEERNRTGCLTANRYHWRPVGAFLYATKCDKIAVTFY